MKEKIEHTGLVVLARSTSSRLPGKALLDIAGKPVIGFILRRLLAVVAKENIVVATSDQPSDDPIAAYCSQNGIKCYRGSLTNVAERFFGAAQSAGWTYAARINGDNVFVDTDLLRRMIRIAETNKYDFISNVKGRTFPKGMSIEIVRTAYFLSKLPAIQSSPEHREHVTSYLYENDANSNHCYVLNTEIPEMAGMQLALDTPEDLARSRYIAAHFTDPAKEYNSAEIFNILKSYQA